MSETIISLKNVSIYQDGKQLVLSNVCIDIKHGEFVYIIGKVGSGKSSIIQTIHAQLPVKIGEVKIAGFDLKKIKDKEVPKLRRKIGVVFQDFQLLNDRNVYENLNFVLKATGWKKKTQIHNRIIKVLEQVGMIGFEMKMPHQLSGGEQQRIVIARALLNKPEIILADEPTGNLDHQNSEEITRLLHEISMEGTAVIMATHDIVQVKRFPSRTYSCENNKFIEVSYSNELIDFDILLK